MKKCWLIPSSNVVINKIGEKEIESPAILLESPFSIYQNTINGNTFLIDNTESEERPETEILSYNLPGLPDKTEVESVNFEGNHPEYDS